MKLPSIFSSLAGTARPILLTLFSFALLTGVASAQHEGKTIGSIDVEYVGSEVIDKDRILANMSTKAGDTLSAVAIDEDIKSLYESGYVENIQVLAKDVGGKVNLLLVVQARSILGAVAFAGNSIIDSEKLTNVVDLKVGESIDGAKVREGATEIQSLYRKRGYPDATVSYATSAPNQQGYSTVTYTVNEGGKGVLRNISFVGNNVFSAADLKKQMEQRPKSLFNPFAENARLDDNTIESDIRAIEDHYQNHGYLSARVLNVSRVRADDGENVDLVITLEEGSPYMVSSVSVEGVQAISLENDVLPYLKIQAGGAYSGLALKGDIKTIESQYGIRGYAEARVTPKLDPAGDNAIRVAYIVSEGESFSVGQIHIEGNIKTKDHVIRRELALLPGAAFDTAALEASRARLMNLNYFHTVDIIPQDTGGYFNEKDVVITVTERPTGTINFGAGFSSIDNLVGFMEISQTNFDIGNWPSLTGGGQRFRMSARVGTERKDFVISLTEPWTFGRRLATTGEFFYRDLTFLSPTDAYDQTEIGGGISFRKPIGEFTYASLGFTPQQVEISPNTGVHARSTSYSNFYGVSARDLEVYPGASPAIIAEAGTFFYVPIAFDLVRDTRDSIFLPRRGYRGALGVEQGVGDVDMTTFTAQASVNYTLPGDIILTGIGKYANSSNADHIFVRQFLGGANNLRGYDFREVGPKDETGEPLGGDSLWTFTGELTVPLVPKIRGALFYDIGEVSGGPGEFGGGVNSNWGVGLRLFILGGAPVRLDYGIPIDGDEFNDNGGQFNFTIGYQF